MEKGCIVLCLRVLYRGEGDQSAVTGALSRTQWRGRDPGLERSTYGRLVPQPVTASPFLTFSSLLACKLLREGLLSAFLNKAKNSSFQYAFLCDGMSYTCACTCALYSNTRVKYAHTQTIKLKRIMFTVTLYSKGETDMNIIPK